VNFAKYGPLQTLMSEAYFGGFDMDSLDFVGFHETRSHDIPRLGNLIGVPLDPKIHVNRTESLSERRAIDEDHDVIATLSSLLASDVRFYEKQRSRWGR
jgi:hypothetical protein